MTHIQRSEYITKERLTAIDSVVGELLTPTEQIYYSTIFHPAVVSLSRKTKGCLGLYDSLNQGIMKTNCQGFTAESVVFDSTRYIGIPSSFRYSSGKGQFVQEDPAIVLFSLEHPSNSAEYLVKKSI
jgi:hypothetical protein